MQYSVVLIPEEDGRYTLTVPALLGCTTFGDTTDEALDNARDAIQQYVASLEAHGKTIPRECGPAEVATVEVQWA